MERRSRGEEEEGLSGGGPRVPVPLWGKQTMDYDFKAKLAAERERVEDLFEYKHSRTTTLLCINRKNRFTIQPK